jgi:hypothetical protein
MVLTRPGMLDGKHLLACDDRRRKRLNTTSMSSNFALPAVGRFAARNARLIHVSNQF